MLGLVKQMVKPLASQTPDAGQIPALRVLGYSALYSRPVLPAFVGVSYLSVRHVFLVKHLYSALDSGTAQPRIREPFYSACGPVCASIVKHRRRRPNTRFAGAWPSAYGAYIMGSMPRAGCPFSVRNATSSSGSVVTVSSAIMSVKLSIP